MFCMACGARAGEGELFCAECGMRIGSTQAAGPQSVVQPQRSRRGLAWAIPVLLVAALAVGSYYYLSALGDLMGLWTGTLNPGTGIFVNVSHIGLLGDMSGTIALSGSIRAPLQGHAFGHHFSMSAPIESLPGVGTDRVEVDGTLTNGMIAGVCRILPRGVESSSVIPVTITLARNVPAPIVPPSPQALQTSVSTSFSQPQPNYRLRFYDSFANEGALSATWQTLNESSNGNSIGVTGRHLAMSANSGSNLNVDTKAAPLTLTRAPVTGDFSFAAKVSWDGSAAGCHCGVGIIAYADPDHYTYLDQFLEGRLSVEYLQGTDNQNNALTYPGVFNPLFLKLTRVGERFSYFWSSDGHAWTPVGQPGYLDLPAMPAVVRVGLDTRSWSSPVTGYYDWAALYTP